MDLYYNDLLRQGGPPQNRFLACPKLISENHQARFRRSVCLYNLEYIKEYAQVFRHEGEASIAARLLTRVVVIHSIIYDQQKVAEDLETKRTGSSSRASGKANCWKKYDWTNATLDFTGTLQLKKGHAKFPPNYFMDDGQVNS